MVGSEVDCLSAICHENGDARQTRGHITLSVVSGVIYRTVLYFDLYSSLYSFG